MPIYTKNACLGDPQITEKHVLTEVYINYTDVPQKDKYQLIFDIVRQGRRYTLFVLKDWMLLSKPKPFVTQEEWNRLETRHKELYHLRPFRADNYLWYKVLRADSTIYSVLSKEPVLVGAKQVNQSIVSRPKELSSLDPLLSTVGDADLIHKDRPSVRMKPGTTPTLRVPYTGPSGNATAATKGAPTKLGVIIQLSNVHALDVILKDFPNSRKALIRETKLDGKSVQTYEIYVGTNNINTVYNYILKSGVAVEVKKLGEVSMVRPPDFYRPKPVSGKSSMGFWRKNRRGF